MGFVARSRIPIWSVSSLALAAAAVIAASLPAAAETQYRFNKMSEGRIAAALRVLHRKNPDLNARVTAVSEAFLDTPYRLGPLGEGRDGTFDSEPLYSFDRLDCTTFVEEVMALSLQPDLRKALDKTLREIRYKAGWVDYVARNHFPEADWLPNNIAAGFIEDITDKVAGERTKFAVKTISKRDWYAKKTLDEIQGFGHEPKPERERRLEALRALGRNIRDVQVTIPYVAVEDLAEFLPSIPSGTIVNFVREDQPDKPVLVTHQAFIVNDGSVKMLRHAAFNRRVEDVPVLEYFAKLEGSSWRVLGINLDAVLPVKK